MHRAEPGGSPRESEHEELEAVATALYVDEVVEEPFAESGAESVPAASPERRRDTRWPRSRAGFVLVGGASSRMGRDKALMPFGDRCLATHIAHQVAETAGSAILVGPPKKYGHLGLPVLPDLYTGMGPIGAVATALRATTADWNLVVACDMPGLTADFLNELFSGAQFGLDCVVPMTPDERVHPLCAVYNRRATRGLERAIQQGVRSMREALPFLKTRYLPIKHPEWVSNLNTPAEWADLHEDAPFADGRD